jgi:hypothetical protein
MEGLANHSFRKYAQHIQSMEVINHLFLDRCKSVRKALIRSGLQLTLSANQGTNHASVRKVIDANEVGKF